MKYPAKLKFLNAVWSTLRYTRQTLWSLLPRATGSKQRPSCQIERPSCHERPSFHLEWGERGYPIQQLAVDRQPHSNSSFLYPLKNEFGRHFDSNLRFERSSSSACLQDHFNRVHSESRTPRIAQTTSRHDSIEMHPFSRVSPFSISLSTSRRSETKCPSFI